MDRRDFLTSAALTAAVLAVPAASTLAAAQAQSALASPNVISRRTRDLVLASPYAQSSSGFSDEAFRLARRIERNLDGAVRLHLETQGPSSIGVLGKNKADLYFATGHSDIAHAPALAYFAGLPGHLGCSSAETVTWVHEQGGQALWDDVLAPFAIKPLLAGHTSAAAGLWSRVQLAKLTGLRIAAEGLARDVLAALGANPLQIAPDGIANALADGSIDAADLSSAEIAASLGVTRAGSRFFTASITNQGSPLVVSFRRALWDDLSMEQHACVEATVRGHAGLSRVSAERNASSFTAALSSAFGCIGNETPPWMAAARRISEAVVADLASRNPQCERINGAYMAFVSRTRKTDCASTS